MSSRFPRFGMVCMGAGFILLGVFSLLVTVIQMRGEWSFLTDGVQALGRVTRNETHMATTRAGTQPVYELLYIFPDARQITHTGRDSVRADIWARAKPGYPLAIQYVAADPDINRIARGGSTGVLGALAAALVGAVFIGLGIYFLAKREIKFRNPKTQITNPKRQIPN